MGFTNIAVMIPFCRTVEEADRVLLEWVALLTRHSYRNTAEDVQQVRDAGWTALTTIQP